MTELWNFLQPILIDLGLRILTAIVIFLFGRWLAKFAANLARKAMQRGKVDESLMRFIGNLVYVGLLAVTIISVLATLGVQTASLVALLGAGGLAIGLALEGALSNFAAGVLVLLFRPFKLDDFVEIAGTMGTVEEIQIFYTILITPDNKKVIIPNGQVTSNTITNYTALGTRRLDMVFGIGYNDDIKKTKEILSEMIAADPRVLPEPAPVVAVLELADSSVNFAVRPYVTVEDYWSLRFDFTEQVKLRFDAEGISIPFPQQDVHLHQLQAA
jgi:small conductance mechanosensitive channel